LNFKGGFKKMLNSKRNVRVAVFGGSLPKPGESAYNEALELGRLLGSAGYTTITGGYIGTMEAISRGTAEAGGHVIGITCDEIETWRPVKPNPWVKEEMRYPTLRKRLYALVDECNAVIALPGGVGTLAELATVWSEMQVFAIEKRPVILVGDGWRAMMDVFYTSLGSYIPKNTWALITFVPDIQSAFVELQSSLT
jgi:uncharacterized protein (TIGR00730 family)